MTENPYKAPEQQEAAQRERFWHQHNLGRWISIGGWLLLIAIFVSSLVEARALRQELEALRDQRKRQQQQQQSEPGAKETAEWAAND